MKHHTGMCALLFAATLLGTGQVTAQVTLSLRGGANIATVGGDDADDTRTRTGVNIGAAVTFAVADNLGIQVGAGYAQKGFTTTLEDVDVILALDYIEVPVLLRIGVPSSGALSTHLFVGPAVSFQASCEVGGSTQGITVSAKCSEADISIKSIDLGGVAGVGVDLAAAGGALSITLDVLYNLGFSSIDDLSDPDDLKNRAWSILAGVGFPIG